MPAGLGTFHSAMTCSGSGLAVAAERTTVVADGAVVADGKSAAAKGLADAASGEVAVLVTPQAANMIKLVQASPIESRRERVLCIWVASAVMLPTDMGAGGNRLTGGRSRRPDPIYLDLLRSSALVSLRCARANTL